MSERPPAGPRFLARSVFILLVLGMGIAAMMALMIVAGALVGP